MPHPADLTPSVWVDYLATLSTRDERIAALATYFRRIDTHGARRALSDLIDPDPDLADDPVTVAAEAALAAIPDAEDYR